MTTPQTQAALLSDDEIAQCINHSRTNLFDRAGTTSFRIARSIEQAVLAKLQPAQEPVQSIPPGLRVGDSHMESLIEAAIQGHAGTRDAMRWLVRQIARVEDTSAQAGELPDERAALNRLVRIVEKFLIPCLKQLDSEGVKSGQQDRDELYAAHAYARAALAARKPLTEKAYKLWMLLDDIDTADDMAKADNDAYRALVRHIHKQRFEILSGEQVDDISSKL